MFSEKSLMQQYTDYEIANQGNDAKIFDDEVKLRNPSGLLNSNFMMSLPFTFHTGEANNAWMVDKDAEERAVYADAAFQQFQKLYQFMVSQGAFVHLMPAPQEANLQDLVFCANAGIVPVHLEERNTVIVSNFTSPPRFGETPVIKRYFENMGYNAIVSPHKFEGEADLKYLHSNVYIGGYGMRSEKATYDWMEREFDMKIIPVQMKNEFLYHLDCSMFPITHEDTLIYVDIYTKEELKAIEQYTNVIPVDRVSAIYTITNSVRVGNYVLNGSHAFSYSRAPHSLDRKIERHKRVQLERICGRLGLEVEYFCLDEYLKGGAALSCLVMHLN